MSQRDFAQASFVGVAPDAKHWPKLAAYAARVLARPSFAIAVRKPRRAGHEVGVRLTQRRKAAPPAPPHLARQFIDDANLARTRRFGVTLDRARGVNFKRHGWEDAELHLAKFRAAYEPFLGGLAEYSTRVARVREQPLDNWMNNSRGRGSPNNLVRPLIPEPGS